MKAMTTTSQTAGLAVINEGMTWEDRIEARVENINICCDTVQQSILFLGAQLAACKWSGEYIIDPIWPEDETSRSWENWLKHRNFKVTSANGESKVDGKSAAAIMAWASCTATITEANAERSIPLPLPSNPAQLKPYLGALQRVDDWEPESWPEQKSAPSNAFETEAPYAAQQPDFLKKWEAVFNQLPPEKRLDKRGNPTPPARGASEQYIQRERQMLTPDVAAPTYNVGQTATTAERMSAAASARPKAPATPKKTQREIDEERRQFELEANARKYRMQLLSLQQSAEALEGLIKTMLVTNGANYLDAMRELDLGAYSVSKDIELLRKSVTVLQSCFRLATEPYVAPAPIDVDIPDVVDV